MRLQLRYFAAAGLLFLGLAAYGQNEARPESPEGFYFFSTDDVAHIRESAKTDWGGRIVASMRRSVDERLTHDMEVPTMEAGHGHFYVCPIHNVTFTFRWDHPTAHYCAACDREYRGVNRYNWGWVNFVHAHNLTFLTNCMYLYLATGESRYAEYIRDMLLDYSNMYPDYMVHNAWRKPSEAHSGKMFGQSLDESVWFSSAARAYVAVRGTLTGAQQRKIELPALRPPAHAYQLHRGTLAAHGGIQRRGEQRGQDHINAPARGRSHKALNQPPVLGGKHGHAIVLRQAVAVKPVGATQRLLGQKARQNAHARAGLAEQLARVRLQQLQRDFIIPGRRALGRYLHPEGVPQPGLQMRAQPIAEQIGVQAGGFAHIIVIRAGQGGQRDGHAAHTAHAHMAAQG